MATRLIGADLRIRAAADLARLDRLVPVQADVDLRLRAAPYLGKAPLPDMAGAAALAATVALAVAHALALPDDPNGAAAFGGGARVRGGATLAGRGGPTLAGAAAVTRVAADVGGPAGFVELRFGGTARLATGVLFVPAGA